MRPRLVLSVLALALGCELTLLFTLTRPHDPKGMALVSGTVRDPYGAPIRAGILRVPADIEGPVCVSDEDGQFAVWLPAGRLRLVAWAADTCQSELVELVLAAGERREGLEMRLRAGGRVTGVLRDEEGNPLPGEIVSAQHGAVHFASPTSSWAETDAAGRFVLEELTPGTVKIWSFSEAQFEELEVSPGSERVLDVVVSGEALEERRRMQHVIERSR